MCIPDTTGHQMTIYVPIALNVCFCTTWENKTSKILHFYLVQYHYLIKITHTEHILSEFLALWFIQLSSCATADSKYLKYLPYV